MKLISWNVNGLRAAFSKGFPEIFREFEADFFSIQESKMQAGQLDAEFEGYHSFWNFAERKGYSGTAIFARTQPESVRYGIGQEAHDQEGRVITLEYPEFFLVNCYTPNSQNELRRLDYRMEWEDAFQAYIRGLDAIRPVILCGDLNVAHTEIDLKNPASNHFSAGFTDQERAQLSRFLESGFVDTFRHFHPEVTGAYTYWSYRGRARENNSGWRIDYFLVSRRFLPRVRSASIHPQILGSDHCPVEITLG